MGRMQLVTIIVSNSKCYLSDDGLIDPTCFRYIEYVSYYCIIFFIFLCFQNKVFFGLIVLISTKTIRFKVRYVEISTTFQLKTVLNNYKGGN